MYVDSDENSNKNNNNNNNNSVDAAAAEIITIMDKRSMVYCKNLVAQNAKNPIISFVL